jgi:hypothetical protein
VGGLLMRIFVVLGTALVLSACASSSTIQPNMSRMHAEQGGRASLTVLGDEAVTDGLRDEVTRLLKGAKAYELVSQTNINPRTQIEIYVTRAATVGRARRVLLGPIAGRAIVTAQVVVRQDEKVVDSFVVDSRSSSGSPLAGTTNQAVELAARRIAERLTS